MVTWKHVWPIFGGALGVVAALLDIFTEGFSPCRLLRVGDVFAEMNQTIRDMEEIKKIRRVKGRAPGTYHVWDEAQRLVCCVRYSQKSEVRTTRATLA